MADRINAPHSGGSLNAIFLSAAAVLEQSVDEIVDETNLGLLFSALEPPRATIDGVDVFASLAAKAAILCIRIARNTPLRRGNTAVAYAAMREFCPCVGIVPDMTKGLYLT
jgi:hypothetical protein